MKILFTGFTSRTVGSERNSYDFMSNVFVLRRALELAGHEVDCRPVSLMTDPCIEQDYDCAVVGIAACQGFSSRFKLGALWALHQFGSRAAIFPSDGKNIYVFPGSVKTCLTGNHGERTPYEYFLYGQIEKDKANTVDAELGETMADLFTSTLRRLPHTDVNPKCDWKMLVPTHTWGNPKVYARHFGADVTVWDPTNVAIPMQFKPDDLNSDDGYRLIGVSFDAEINAARERAWVVSSLQDNSPWVRKQNCKWPVVIVGNKRAASKGEALAYIPERELIDTIYRKYWGHLAFGYPLAEGGWWRMRYVHAGMAGIVTCCDENDARRMPQSYQHSRIILERWSDEKLAQVARDQWEDLMAASCSADESVARVDAFVKGLV